MKAQAFGGLDRNSLDKTTGGEAVRASEARYLTMPIGVAVSEDTRIEMYAHKSVKSEFRNLIWFVVFHPTYYAGRSEIKFEKKKVDMLHKDSKCNKTNADFVLTLKMSDNAQISSTAPRSDPQKSMLQHESPLRPFVDACEESMLQVLHLCETRNP